MAMRFAPPVNFVVSEHPKIMDAIVALIRLIFWALFFVGAAIVSPPIILIWTKLDGSKPYWATFWRRYRTVLFESFVAGP